MNIKLINGDASDAILECDMIVTDPPFDFCGKKLANILDAQTCDHLLLITTMRQLIEFCKHSAWQLSFDFVLDHVVPKKAKSKHQPNYTHSTCVYMTRNNARSLFDRKRRERSDTFDGKGYWPTILRASRDRMHASGYAKNTQALTDVIGCFDVKLIADLFAGSGTTALAAFELDINCILVEKDKKLCDQISRQFEFFGMSNLEKMEQLNEICID